LTDRLRALDARVEEAAVRVVAATDSEAVHDLRVAIRRLRTVLELSGDVFGRFRTREVRRALRDVHRATGALRDEEVLVALIRSLGLADPGVSSWLDVRARRERRLRAALRRAMRSGSLQTERDLLRALLAFRVNPARDRRLDKFARRAFATAKRDADRLRDPPVDSPGELHLLRIACKRLRYVAETFAPALAPEQSEVGANAARLQGRLGDLHDIDVAFESIGRARSLRGPSRAALVKALRARRDERVAAYLRALAAHPVPLPDRSSSPDPKKSAGKPNARHEEAPAARRLEGEPLTPPGAPHS
jgi:CHAD domain-containing protein